MKLSRVYPILDTPSLETRGIALRIAAQAFLEGGAGILQIRHKGHWSRDARKLMGPDAVIGFSSHSVRQLSAAGGEPVDYVALGPVFRTVSKCNPYPVIGVDEVRRCRALLEQPLGAIGGITRENSLEVLNAGADSVAVIACCQARMARLRPLNLCVNGWKNGNNS